MDLITNRTEGAVYGYADLNRVESAVKIIADHLSSMGINVSLNTKTNWAPPENFSPELWPVQSQMKRYLENVEVIKNLFPNSVRLPSSMSSLTWTGANNIEKVLSIALERIDGIQSTYKYSGELYAGEEI